MANSANTTTLPPPCHNPMVFARCIAWDCHPVNQTGKRRQEPTQNASSHDPKRDVEPAVVARNERGNVKRDGGCKQAKRKYDQHWVKRVPGNLYSAFHNASGCADVQNSGVVWELAGNSDV